MGDVFIIYGNQIDTMVRRLTEESGALNRLRSDDTVVIKPHPLFNRTESRHTT